MKRPFCILCYLTAGTLVAAAVGVFGASAASAQAPAEPTKEHEVLKEDVGTWDAEVTFTIPGSEPMKSKGVETNRMVGGLWLVSDFDGEFAGSKFTGHGIVGYDSTKKKYVGSWVDNMGTSITTMEGEYDADKKTMTIVSEVVEPASGMKMKQTQKTVYKGDTKKFTISMDIPGLGEQQIMEMTLSRRKE